MLIGMTKYRVLGTKEEYFYVDIEAEDNLEAYDISLQLNTDKWFKISTDETIEPYQVID